MTNLPAEAVQAAERPVVHAHHPPACGSDMSDGSLWTGNMDRVTCTACTIALAVAAERERIAQLAERHEATYWKSCGRRECQDHHGGNAPLAALIRQGGTDGA
jgi:hypothetical protein